MYVYSVRICRIIFLDLSRLTSHVSERTPMVDWWSPKKKEGGGIDETICQNKK